MDNRQWTIDNGQMDNGQMDNRQWTIDNGQIDNNNDNIT
jgi:nitrogen fixation-related uncharacterized protein